MHPFPRPCVSRDMTTIAAPPQGSDVRRTVAVDFLYLELSTCSRCGTDTNLERALAALDDVLPAIGAQVEVRHIHVQSLQQARELQLVMTSPTIRVDGRDISPEPLESEVRADGCGCGSGVSCRLWPYGGADIPRPRSG